MQGRAGNDEYNLMMLARLMGVQDFQSLASRQQHFLQGLNKRLAGGAVLPTWQELVLLIINAREDPQFLKILDFYPDEASFLLKQLQRNADAQQIFFQGRNQTIKLNSLSTLSKFFLPSPNEIKALDKLAKLIDKVPFNQLDENQKIFIIQLKNKLGESIINSHVPEEIVVRLNAIRKDPELVAILASDKARAGTFLMAMNDIIRKKHLPYDFSVSEFLGKLHPQAQPARTFEDYQAHTKLRDAGAAAFSHEVYDDARKKVRFGRRPARKHFRRWFGKYEKDVVVARREVLAQEIFRLFIPYQPKTRLAFDAKSNPFVMSQGVEGYTSLANIPGIPPDSREQTITKKIISGEFKGMGDVLVMSLLMNETDLKLGNMGVDKNGRIVKIDGDWCFSRLRGANKNCDITPAIISQLPFRGTYHGYNWLDQMQGGTLNPNPVMTCFETPAFRQEVNSALLRAILMPDFLLHKMVVQHVGYNPFGGEPEVQQAMQELLQRKAQMQAAAYANPSFQAFMRTPEAEKVKNEFLENLLEFKTRGKNYLIDAAPGQMQYDAIGAVKKAYNERFEQVCAAMPVPAPPAAVPVGQTQPRTGLRDTFSSAECQTVLTAFLKSVGIGIHDSKMDPEIRKIVTELLVDKNDNVRFVRAVDYIQTNPTSEFARFLDQAFRQGIASLEPNKAAPVVVNPSRIQVK